MNEFFLDLGISAVLTTLKLAVKNPARKAEIRRVMLKIYTQIGIVFNGDSEFVEASAKGTKK